MMVGLLEEVGNTGPPPALQLPRALGGDNDEPVSALLWIVRQGAVRVIGGEFGQPYYFEPLS